MLELLEQVLVVYRTDGVRGHETSKFEFEQ